MNGQPMKDPQDKIARLMRMVDAPDLAAKLTREKPATLHEEG